MFEEAIEYVLHRDRRALVPCIAGEAINFLAGGSSPRRGLANGAAIASVARVSVAIPGFEIGLSRSPSLHAMQSIEQEASRCIPI
jgi:hypothetical protein